jgi:hypothetical protein
VRAAGRSWPRTRRVFRRESIAERSLGRQLSPVDGMMGSVGVAAWIAHCAFWILLCAGWVRRELDVRGIAVFIGLWLAGFAGARLVLSGMLFVPYVAILDIALVFVVFKGDVRLT